MYLQDTSNKPDTQADKSFRIKIRDVFFLLIYVYYAQGALYPTGTILSKIALALIFIICAYYLVKLSLIKSSWNNLFYIMWTSLLLLNVFGFVITYAVDSTVGEHFGMLRGILISLLPFYPCYFFSKRNNLTAKYLAAFALLSLPILVMNFYVNEANVLETGREVVVNNAAYAIIGLIPFLFLIKSRVLSLALTFIIIVMTITGLKRGAIFVGGIGLMIYFYYLMRTVSGKNKGFIYSLSFIALCCITYFAYDLFASNELLINRMMQISEGGSGRDRIFLTILSSWANAESALNLLFGYGFAASFSLAGNYAHNDWLELLSNFGLLGIFIYLMLFFAATKYVFHKGWSIDKRLTMLVIIVMWFLITLFSMGYMNNVTAYMRTIMLAYLIGSNSKTLAR